MGRDYRRAVGSTYIRNWVAKQSAIGWGLGCVFGLMYHYGVAAPELNRIRTFYEKYDVEYAIQEAKDEAERIEKLKSLAAARE